MVLGALTVAAYDRVLDFLGLPRSERYPTFERHNARPRNRLDGSVAAALAEHYAPFDARLARWLGYRPSWMDDPA